MFKKPVRIKSNNQVKGSERKNVKDLFCKSFPNVSEVEANNLFNNKKETLNCIKLVTHDNETVQVYCIQKQPLLFSVRDKLFPTVYLLWNIPNLIPYFTIHPQVMSYINSGADLMLPGVITPTAQTGLSKYGNVNANSLVYINLSNNKCAVAIGTTCLSSFDMERSGGKGKCVNVHHFLGDYLCNIDGAQTTKPNLGPPDFLVTKDYESDFPELGKNKQEINRSEITSDGSIPQDKDLLEDTDDKNETDVSNTNENFDMDEVLMHCFLASIKYSKTITLPILTSNFYKLQMLPACPEGHTLDIKKTSYKKLKNFLDEMCKIQLITVKEVKKGVETIMSINKEHPKYNEFYLKPDLRPKTDSNEDAKNVNKTTVTESYVITENVLPIFQQGGYRKGDVIDRPNIHKFVTSYIKENNCQEIDNNKLVKPSTTILRKICKTEQSVSWEEVFEKVCESMKNCFKVNVGQDEIFNKGKISPITMNVSVRSGNKKVTIIDNLEVFGININEFAKECQHGVAASTSITPKPPGKKCDQLLVQGNQVVFVYNILTEKYKVPKKYVLGLEKAPKKKK
ncbi:eukaryotic translation initiation factor 2D [Sitophilus oryzae]|uniref:Eukaryotic translation initiation factor 2D n=1 Tax=Sitophilus oryzae TaxID=7048 RepID=A0A6J2XEF3_SITOR|nr:eukaryotic translation initiation factor 2D [Sitophilus oryzae]